MLTMDDQLLVASLRVASVVRVSPATSAAVIVATSFRIARWRCRRAIREAVSCDGATVDAMHRTTAACSHGKDDDPWLTQRRATKAPRDGRKAPANGRPVLEAEHGRRGDGIIISLGVAVGVH